MPTPGRYDVPLPPAFVALLTDRPAEGGPSGSDWLRALPGLLAAACERWDLSIDGPPWHGYCALVLPVRRHGRALALKVGWPHGESRHEHLALRAWSGRGAVQLIAAHPGDGALLLERLADRPLSAVTDEASAAVLGALTRRLAVPAFPQLDRLSDWTRAFLAQTSDVAAVSRAGVPRRFVEQARSLAVGLAGEPGIDATLVHADLHDGNVLTRRGDAAAGPSAGHDEWVAIDPKPMAAEPAYALAPALWNRWPDALASNDPPWRLRCRLAWLCEAGGIEEERARAWTLIRLVAHAADRAGAADPDAGPAPMTAVIAAMKAVASDR